MTESYDKACANCGVAEEQALLEPCSVCGRWFCSDCAHKAGFGRRFCSGECARAYYFTGESDDDNEDTSWSDE